MTKTGPKTPGGLLRLVLAVIAAGCLGAPLQAVDVWTPETGDVNLEQLPRSSVEDRRKHALALIGAGQWGGGVDELRELMDANPSADWIPKARLSLASGYLANGLPVDAYDALEVLAAAGPDSALAVEARRLQYSAARVRTVDDTDGKTDLFERLLETAPAWEDVIEVHKAKADALFEANHFLDAQDAYLTLIDIFPRSQWVPYCWYKVAESEWELAVWLGRGQENLRAAEEQLRDFVDSFPTDTRVPAAEAKIEEAREIRADACWRTVRYYVDAAGKPWAALPYVIQILVEFEGSPEARLAEAEMSMLRWTGQVPGELPVLRLPGAGWKEAGQ